MILLKNLFVIIVSCKFSYQIELTTSRNNTIFTYKRCT